MYVLVQLMLLRFLYRGYCPLQPVHGRTRGRRGMSYTCLYLRFYLHMYVYLRECRDACSLNRVGGGTT